MNSIDLMEYWFKSADEDYDTMLYMKDGRVCSWKMRI